VQKKKDQFIGFTTGGKCPVVSSKRECGRKKRSSKRLNKSVTVREGGEVRKARVP